MSHSVSHFGDSGVLSGVFTYEKRRGRGRTTVCDSLTLLVAACGACAACDGFGFARNAATTFDVFYWLQVTNFDVLLNSAANGPDYIDIWGLCLLPMGRQRLPYNSEFPRCRNFLTPARRSDRANLFCLSCRLLDRAVARF
jgi:hypothetical protein